MNNRLNQLVMIVALGAGVALIGCEKKDSSKPAMTDAQKAAAEKAKKDAAAAGNDMKDAAKKAGDAMKDATSGTSGH